MSRLTRLAHQQRTSPSAAAVTIGTVATGAVAAILALGGCSAGAIGQNTPLSSGQNFVSGSGTTIYHPGSRPLAPDVSGRTLTGARLRLDSFRGSVLVLNFWGSWCAPCRAEAPDLAALAHRLGSRGVRFLGIDIQDDPTNAEAFMHTFQIPYPSLNDPGDEIALAFRDTVPAAAIPTTLVIDRTGHIAARVIGSVSYAGLKTLVSQVLTEKSGGGAAR